MAKFKHTISYKVNGSGPLLEAVIIADTVDSAKNQFTTDVPNGRIESVLTTVPSA